jgi:hypothetical protein
VYCIATGGTRANGNRYPTAQLYWPRSMPRLTPTVLTVIKHAEEQGGGERRFWPTPPNCWNRPRSQRSSTRPASASRGRKSSSEAESTGGYDLLMMGQRQSRPLLTRIRGLVTQKVVAHAMPCRCLSPNARRAPCSRSADLRQRRAVPIVVASSSACTCRRFLPAPSEVTVLHVMSQISAAPGVSKRR